MKLFKKHSKSAKGEAAGRRLPFQTDPDLVDIALCEKILRVSIILNFVLACVMIVCVSYTMLRNTTYRSATNEMRIEFMEPSEIKPHDPLVALESIVLDKESEEK